MGLIYRYLTHADDVHLNQGDSTSSDSSTDKSGSFIDRYLSSVVRIRMILLAQSRSFWFLLPRWCYCWFSSMYREEEVTLAPIRAMARQTIREAQPSSPLAQLSLKSTHSGSNTIATERTRTTKEPPSKDLLDETITLLFAGQDTSAATLSWTLHLLSIHPDIQQRVYEEVSTLNEKSFRDAMKLPLLDAVIKESMRLFPVAPFVVRRLVEDLRVESNNNDSSDDNSTLTLPRGSLACIWIYALHRNPDLWERPNDFWPERWLSSSPSITIEAYMPYCLGPRNCLGQPLAQIVLRTILARIIQRVQLTDPEWKKEEGVDGNAKSSLYKDMQAGFTILPLGGVHLYAKAR